MAVKKKTFHSAQGSKLKAVSGSDIMVIAQADSTALEGYRTVNITMDMCTDAILEAIRNTPNNGLLTIDPNRGLKGNGSVANPFQVDLEYFRQRWVFNQYTNISQVGNVSLVTLPIVKGTGFNLTVGSDIPVYLGGVNGSLRTQTINLATYVPSPANKTIYMYLHTVNGTISFKLATTTQPERYDLTYIATITTNANSIVTVLAKPFMRVGNYRLSETLQGSAIPVTAGNPSNQDFTTWGGEGTIGVVQAGVDPAQKAGGITLLPAEGRLRAAGMSARFFVKNRDEAIKRLGGFYVVEIQTQPSFGSFLSVDDRAFINGMVISRGPTVSFNVWNCDHLIREGWNEVRARTGWIFIKAPFLKG